MANKRQLSTWGRYDDAPNISTLRLECYRLRELKLSNYIPLVWDLLFSDELRARYRYIKKEEKRFRLRMMQSS